MGSWIKYPKRHYWFPFQEQNWYSYEERIEQYFLANYMDEEKKYFLIPLAELYGARKSSTANGCTKKYLFLI